jgi:hypothetical protein
VKERSAVKNRGKRKKERLLPHDNPENIFVEKIIEIANYKNISSLNQLKDLYLTTTLNKASRKKKKRKMIDKEDRRREMPTSTVALSKGTDFWLRD